MTDPSRKTFINLAPAPGASGPRDDDLYRAVRDTVAGEYELLGELGRGDSGSVVYLARDRSSGSLVALRLDRGTDSEADFELTVLPQLDESVPSLGSSCPYCGRQVQGWARYCPTCGRDISGEPEAIDSVSGFTTEELLAAVRESASDDYEVLGEMARARGGGRVYFARDLATGAIVALRLERERSDAGPDQFSLGRTQVLRPLVADMGAQYASPTVVSTPAAGSPSAASSPKAPHAPRPAPDRQPPPPATPAAKPAPPPARVAAPEGRTVVGLPVARPGATDSHPPSVETSTIDERADARTTRVGRRRTIIIAAGVVVALLGALALSLAGGGDELVDFDSVTVDTSVATNPQPPIDSTASRPVVDTPIVTQTSRVVLVVTGDLPASTSVLVDGRQFRGRRATVTPGMHTLLARADGYEPYSQRVEFAGDTVMWSPRLRPRVEPPRDSAVVRVPVDSPPKPPAPTCARSAAAQDWATARTLCRREGGAGDVAAQRQLGIILLRGLGGPVDEFDGVNWVRRAADADDPQALFELGRVHQTRKRYRDDGRAYDLFRRAALRGHAEAQLLAGRALEHGIGTPQNLREAFLMYEQAAKAGFPPAQNAYGVFLKKGLGTARDDRKALEWLTKAAQGGSPDAHFHIGELHEQGRAGLPKSRAAALEWYRKGAALGSAEARRALQR